MNQKILAGFGLILLLIVIVQSVFLYRMSSKVEQLSQTTETQAPLLDTPLGKTNPLDNKLFSPDDQDWNPFKEMQRTQNELNKIFGDLRSNLYRNPDFDQLIPLFSFSPMPDIQDDGDQFIVKVDIPGSDESNINVTVKDQHLSISATTSKSSKDKEKGRLFRNERFMGQFERSVDLPAPVLAEKMKTDYSDGVLTITLPKA